MRRQDAGSNEAEGRGCTLLRLALPPYDLPLLHACTVCRDVLLHLMLNHTQLGSDPRRVETIARREPCACLGTIAKAPFP